MGEVSLTIDGTNVKAREGSTVLEAARDAGIYMPSLCADPDLEPYGGCRLCLVEIENLAGLLASCTTPVAEGMVVHTNTRRVNEVRRRIVELLLCDHPDNCLLCPKNEHCELQRIAGYVGIDVGIGQKRFKKLERPPFIDPSNPFFIRDSSMCILCGRCMRVCDEIQGVGALEVLNDGLSSKIITAGDRPILESICESCGQCVAKCPTGALMPKDFKWPTREVKTICPYCGVGCGVSLAVRGDEVVAVSGDHGSPVSKGSLCVKGQFGFKFINHPTRLTTPLIRKNGQLEKASWEEALALVADKLKNYRADEVGVISSARSTNEASYIMQKFGRVVLGTNNVDHCARL
jgi:predicted molibdopterin-dependent oxidoreductase YjgC